MRIRLTLDIERTPKPEAPTEEAAPVGYDLIPAQTERAGWQRTGFTIPNPQEDS